jgi:hypothetical protein
MSDSNKTLIKALAALLILSAASRSVSAPLKPDALLSQSPNPTSFPLPSAVSSGTTVNAISPDATGVTPAVKGELPGWLGWLLLPLFGGGLWWLARGRGADSISASPAAVPPSVPAPPAAMPAAAPVGTAALGATAAGAAMISDASDTELSDTEPSDIEPLDTEPLDTEPLLNRATVVDDSRIILTLRTANAAYAYWEAPEVSKAALQDQGGRKFQLRVHDVTDLDVADLNADQPPHSTQVYDLSGTEQDYHVAIPQSDRDYLAEIGYETAEGNWLKLARSSPVGISAAIGGISPKVTAGGAVAGAVAGADEGDRPAGFLDPLEDSTPPGLP